MVALWLEILEWCCFTGAWRPMKLNIVRHRVLGFSHGSTWWTVCLIYLCLRHIQTVLNQVSSEILYWSVFMCYRVPYHLNLGALFQCKVKYISLGVNLLGWNGSQVFFSCVIESQENMYATNLVQIDPLCWMLTYGIVS